VHYADGSAAHLPVRYGREVVAPSPDSLPQRTDDPVWLVDQPPQRFLVRELVRTHIRHGSYAKCPSSRQRALLDLGAQVVAAHRGRGAVTLGLLP